MSEKQKPKPIGAECRFVVHIPKNEKLGTEDTHLIKEQVHFDDGSVKPRMREVINEKRPWYMTRVNKQNHFQKKEWEEISNLDEHWSTDSDLRYSVATALGKHWSNDSLRQLCASPYIYGTDMTCAAHIKFKYLEKYPNLKAPYTVASLDIETDVLYETQDPILITVCFEGSVKTFGTKKYFEGVPDPVAEYERLSKFYLSEYTKPFPVDPTKPDGIIYPHPFNFNLEVCEDTVEIMKKAIAQLHEWMPDFVAIWNINFDIPRMNDTFLKYGVDLADAWCDPRIKTRVCRYKEGLTKKVTSSGKVKPINPSMQWHTFILSASFYPICQMSSYRYVRIAKPEDASYKLGDTLDRELNRNKLSFREADAYSELDWHRFMQSMYKMMYVIYNNWDAMSQLVLDCKTKDLSMAVGMNAYITDFSKFNSQPKKIADAFSVYAKPLGYIVASVGAIKEDIVDDGEDDDDDEDDDSSKNPYVDDNFQETLGLRGWILTLKSTHQVLGLPVIKGNPMLQTGIRGHTYDSDAVGAYPSATESCNVSMETNIREIIGIDGIPLDVFKMQNMNLICGSVNSIEYCTNVFKLPKPAELLNYI